MSGIGPLAEPHHDGSELYVPERPTALGDEITVRVRVPRASSADVVALRYVRDGEPRGVRAEIDEETDTDVWWRATLPVWNPTVSYRWVLAGGTLGYRWLNGAGLFARDVTDADDFRIVVGEGGPDWHLRSVVYQIFPDRFATTGRSGPSHGPGTPCRGAARPRRRTSGSAATSRASRSTSTTSRRSGRTSSTSPRSSRRGARTATTPPPSSASTRCSAATLRWRLSPTLRMREG